jgi:hypothetical protein
MRYGKVDRDLLAWVKKLAETYPGSNPRDPILRSVEMQLALTDEQIAGIAHNERASSDGGLSVKKYSVPLLDAGIPSFWQLPRELQGDLLDIRARLDLFNEEVEHAQYYFRLTFGDLGAENRKRVEENLVGCYLNIARSGRAIVDKIGKVNV